MLYPALLHTALHTPHSTLHYTLHTLHWVPKLSSTTPACSSYSSVTNMLSTLNLPPLQQRRERAKLIMMYKIINDLIDIPKEYFTPNDSRLRKGYYRQLTTNIDSYKFSFFPSAIKLWNPLPPYIINSPSLDNFCNNLSNYICAL